MYHPNDCTRYVDGKDVCDDCLDEYYFLCDHCEEYHHRDDATDAYDSHGNSIQVCSDCRDNHYYLCEDCDEWYHGDCVTTAYDADGVEHYVCENCENDYDECPHCEALIEIREDGTCPHCGAVVEEEKTEEVSA